MGAQIGEGNLFFAAAVEDGLTQFGRQAAKRGINIEIIVLGQAMKQVEEKRITPVPTADGAGSQAQRVVLYHPIGVEKLPGTEAVAIGTGARRIVKRKDARLQFIQAVAHA